MSGFAMSYMEPEEKGGVVMHVWEYKTNTWLNREWESTFDVWLNKQGKDGWEAFEIIPLPNGENWVIFKRPKED